MTLPAELAALLADDSLPPAEMYARCVSEATRLGLSDYGLTRDLAYAAEVRLALDVLRHGRPERWHNFGDLRGDADAILADFVAALPERRLVFVGGGPFPVTALQLRDRWPDASVTCVDCDPAAYWLGRAVCEAAGADVEVRLGDALEIDYAPFTGVILAAMVHPREAVVERVLRGSAARVLVRGAFSPVGSRVTVAPCAFGADGAFRGS